MAVKKYAEKKIYLWFCKPFSWMVANYFIEFKMHAQLITFWIINKNNYILLL